MNKKIFFRIRQIFFVCSFIASMDAFSLPLPGDDLHPLPENAYDKLIRSEARPTVQDVLDAFDGKIPPRKIEELLNHPWSANVDSRTVYDYLPLAIARLELAFPGGIWAGLGRDAADVSDLLDSFYIGMGQPGRAVRINASRGTFLPLNGKMFMQMLKELGLDTDFNETMRPFVIIDRTGYHNTTSTQSQSVQLIKLIYAYFGQKTARPASTLFRKVGLVSTIAGQPVDRPEMFFRDLEIHSARVGAAYPIFTAHIPDFSYFTDRTPWHDSFTTLTTYPDGRIGGTIGPPSRNIDKTVVLDTMIQGYQIVTTPAFQNQVRLAAKKLGYDFDEHLKMYNKGWVPPPPPEPQLEDLAVGVLERSFSAMIENHPELVHIAEYLKNIYQKQIVQGMQKRELEIGQQSNELRQKMMLSGFEKLMSLLKVEAEPINLSNNFALLTLAYFKTLPEYKPYKGYFSDNAKAVKDIFDEVMRTTVRKLSKDQYVLDYIQLLGVAKNNKNISSKDYRRLILYAFAEVSSNEEFYFGMAHLLEKTPELKEHFIEHAEVYLTSRRNNKAGQFVYLQMVWHNLLPKPSECDQWLKGKQSDPAGDEPVQTPRWKSLSFPG